MKCLNPVKIPLKGTKPVKWIETSCKKCEPCMIIRQLQFTQRMEHEAKYWEAISFITLTYDTQYAPQNNSLIKSEIHDFIKRLKHEYNKQAKAGHFRPLNLAYVGTGEYGNNGTKRPHYHAILYGYDSRPYCYWRNYKIALKAWGKGNITLGKAEKGSFTYVAQHQTKKQTYQLTDKQLKPFLVLTKSNRSKKCASIGARYVKTHEASIIADGYRIPVYKKNHKEYVPVNNYYKTKLPPQDLIAKWNDKLKREKDLIQAAISVYGDNYGLSDKNRTHAEKYKIALEIKEAVEKYNHKMYVKRPSCGKGRGL